MSLVSQKQQAVLSMAQMLALTQVINGTLMLAVFLGQKALRWLLRRRRSKECAASPMVSPAPSVILLLRYPYRIHSGVALQSLPVLLSTCLLRSLL